MVKSKGARERADGRQWHFEHFPDSIASEYMRRYFERETRIFSLRNVTCCSCNMTAAEGCSASLKLTKVAIRYTVSGLKYSPDDSSSSR